MAKGIKPDKSLFLCQPLSLSSQDQHHHDSIPFSHAFPTCLSAPSGSG
jgi:hypothetical protein